MKTKNFFCDLTLWLFVFSLAIGVGATVYQMMVVVPAFSEDFPNGMKQLIQSHVETRHFWASPWLQVSHLMAILSLILNWRSRRKKWILLSILFSVFAILITTFYFVPRLHIMGLIDDQLSTDLDLLRRSITEWVRMDVIRFWTMIVPAFFCALKAATIPLPIAADGGNSGEKN